MPEVFSGQLHRAYDQAHRTYRTFVPLGDPILLPYFGCVLFSLWQADEDPEAQRWLGELREVALRTLEMIPGFLGWRVILIDIEQALGNEDFAKREFGRFAENGYRGINRDTNYVPTLFFLARAAARVGDQEQVARLYDLLLPYAGLHAATLCGYAGPVHHALSLLQRALGDYATARDHMDRALADVERIEARPWIEKIRREIVSLNPTFAEADLAPRRVPKARLIPCICRRSRG
jgi:hypothetical protein